MSSPSPSSPLSQATKLARSRHDSPPADPIRRTKPRDPISEALPQVCRASRRSAVDPHTGARLIVLFRWRIVEQTHAEPHAPDEREPAAHAREHARRGLPAFGVVTVQRVLELRAALAR